MSKVTSRDKLLDATFDEVYMYGYAGASTAKILKIAGVPKGSMYHHFASKKEMVIAMIKERLVPKVRDSFFIEIDENSRALEIIKYLFKKIGKNKMLIQHGCPLHKLMFEMGAQDDEITELCYDEFLYLQKNFAKIIDLGKKQKTLKDIESLSLAEYIITASWGALSIAPKYASKDRFLKDTDHIIEYIKA
jgi:TetR/AcrR family transcriptional repressor of nem operon